MAMRAMNSLDPGMMPNGPPLSAQPANTVEVLLVGLFQPARFRMAPEFLVAASRQSAAIPRSDFQRRSAETPLRRGSRSQCARKSERRPPRSVDCGRWTVDCGPPVAPPPSEKTANTANTANGPFAFTPPNMRKLSPMDPTQSARLNARGLRFRVPLAHPSSFILHPSSFSARSDGPRSRVPLTPHASPLPSRNAGFSRQQHPQFRSSVQPPLCRPGTPASAGSNIPNPLQRPASPLPSRNAGFSRQQHPQFRSSLQPPLYRPSFSTLLSNFNQLYPPPPQPVCRPPHTQTSQTEDQRLLGLRECRGASVECRGREALPLPPRHSTLAPRPPYNLSPPRSLLD